MNLAIMSRKRSLYSTKRLIQEAKIQGLTTILLNPLKCDVIVGKSGHHIYYNKKIVKDVHAVIPRIGASVTKYGLNVLRQFVEMGIPAISSPDGIAIARDKFHCLQTLSQKGMLIPKTIMVRNPKNVSKAIDRVGGVPVIIKLIRGTQGIGVILAESKSNAVSMLDTLWSLGQHILIQEYIRESNGTDIRCMVVNGKVVACCRRIARLGEFRSNFHKGAIVEPVELTAEQQNIAVRAAETLRLGVAGVDMLESLRGMMVIEVNASPGFEGLEYATGINVAEAIVAFARNLAEKNKIGNTA